LGKVGYYRSFIRDYASVAMPLYNALDYSNEDDDKSKKTLDDQDIPISEAMEAACTALTTRLRKAPVLAYPDFQSHQPFVLDTDWFSYNTAMGAVLSQQQRGKEVVICYGAKMLSTTQARYSPTQGDMCAVISFISTWRPLLRYRPFILRATNSALKWMDTSTPAPLNADQTGCPTDAPAVTTQRWRHQLTEHRFTTQPQASCTYADMPMDESPHQGMILDSLSWKRQQDEANNSSRPVVLQRRVTTDSSPNSVCDRFPNSVWSTHIEPEYLETECDPLGPLFYQQ
jgi:hypothetical protein